MAEHFHPPLLSPSKEPGEPITEPASKLTSILPFTAASTYTYVEFDPFSELKFPESFVVHEGKQEWKFIGMEGSTKQLIKLRSSSNDYLLICPYCVVEFSAGRGTLISFA